MCVPRWRLKLYGEDLETLDRLTGQIKGVLDKVPGVADLSAEANKGKPQLIIKVDRAAASRYGINADEILEVVQAGIGGSTVSTLIDGTRRFDIAARLADEYRVDPNAIASIPLRTGEGALVPFLAGGEDRDGRRATRSSAARPCSAMRCCRWT